MPKDGAPQVLAPFVMPIFVGVYFALMCPVISLVTRLCPSKDFKSTRNLLTESNIVVNTP